MVPREAMSAAHVAAVMVRAHGPDPKGRKMRRHAFFHTESGDTTLSASGFLSLKTPGINDGERVILIEESGFESATVSGSSVVVVTCASIVEPFLSQQPYGASAAESQACPKLITGAEVDVLVEVPGKPTDGGDHSRCWLSAQLQKVVDIPAAGAALQTLLDVHGGSVDGAWEVGWALAPVEGSSQLQGLNTVSLTSVTSLLEDEPARHWATSEKEPLFGSSAPGGGRVGNLAMTATRVAILTLCAGVSEILDDRDNAHACELHKLSKVSFDLTPAESRKRGDFLLAVGSPFGALSPLHFHNSLSAGVVANCWPPTSRPTALLMADVRCLPGMEGGPVFDERGSLVGMLTRPLRQRGGGAEVQLVMTSEVLAPALKLAGVTLGVPFRQEMYLSNDLLNNSAAEEIANNFLEVGSCGGVVADPAVSQSRQCVSSAIERAVDSVVLVTIGDGAWASGVILSKNGLILTNAHLLEPWRFGKMRSAQSAMANCSGKTSACVQNKFVDSPCNTQGNCLLDHIDLSVENHSSDYEQGFSLSDATCRSYGMGIAAFTTHAGSKPLDLTMKSYQRIRVRLDYLQSRSWHDAKAVYVSQGPLDIALLQLVAPPPGLRPIIPEELCPNPGSTAVVIGHGLFGPRSELCPSVSAGVVARVVKAEIQSLRKVIGAKEKNARTESPAMLQTTAAVHPGGSGGAVVNNEGRMIGLVTSNARHSGGSVIPFLNFSVPVVALAPTFDFAAGGGVDLSLLFELDKPDKLLSAVWALVPSTPQKPNTLPSSPRVLLPFSSPAPPPLPNDKGAKKSLPKGSRFAKFMSEKGAGLGFCKPAENGQLQQQTVVDMDVGSDAVLEPKFCSRL